MTKPYLKQRRIKFGISAQKRWDKLKSLFTRRRLAMDGIINFARTQNENPAPPAEGEITVILNTYARTEYLPSQIEALKRQTVPIREIWIWSNQSHKPQYDLSPYCDRWVVSNHNWKFFGRFTLALMAETPYIALFDDDILPGPRWLENCLETIKRPEYGGILGGSGVRLPTAGGYEGNTRVGWHGPHNEKPEEVDLVGHAWFMERNILPLMWRETPHTLANGEDIHLCYTAQKYGGIKTFVPPHPPDDPEKWSSHPIIARSRGSDSAAHSVAHKKKHDTDRDRIVDRYRQNGWQLFNERNPS